MTPQKSAIWDKKLKSNLISCNVRPNGFVLPKKKSIQRDKSNPSALTVLFPVSDAVADGLVEAQSGSCGHRAQDGRQRRAFSLWDILLLLLVLLFFVLCLLLEFYQSFQREISEVFAKVLGHGLKLVLLLFCFLTVCQLR